MSISSYDAYLGSFFLWYILWYMHKVCQCSFQYSAPKTDLSKVCLQCYICFLSSQLRVRGLPGDDRAVRTSYKLLGAVSLLQLALTVALQINNFRQRQRARQEWKQYRNLASSGYSHSEIPEVKPAAEIRQPLHYSLNQARYYY